MAHVESFEAQSMSLSFEFFPPQTPAGMERLQDVHQQLLRCGPEFFSVTYGAGGSNQTRTIQTVLDLQAKGTPVAPHISCIGTTREALYSLLDQYRAAGITRVVALRGDLPSGMGGSTGGDFRHASDLVRFIREQWGDDLHIEVAAYPEMHPQSDRFEDDIQHFVNKANAGANSAITQYFYNTQAYFHFVESVRVLGCQVPIIPGIMPITNYSKLVRFSDACGADIPRWIRRRLEQYQEDEESLLAFGLDVVTDLCEELLQNGAPGLHLYSMNQSAVNLALCDRLGFTS
jgi:methylenetetrahydrofolate reductase (NADPH)